MFSFIIAYYFYYHSFYISKFLLCHVIMFTQYWSYWVFNRLQKSGRNWVLKIEYSISPDSELKLSAQLVHFFRTIIDNSISPNSELRLSTQYLNFFTNYWVWNLLWTLNYWHLLYLIDYTISLNSEYFLSTQFSISI